MTRCSGQAMAAEVAAAIFPSVFMNYTSLETGRVTPA